ncbi:MAG: dihydrolipoyl dehydrogenase [Clostridiales bacterium]|nr:dihydrolipoyl dehydrogenase [Clostridiales bacterium]
MVYDLIVIGAGPAGYLGAERAAKAGMSTLVIEKNKVGGVCLNEGCVPTKSFLYSAKMFDHAKEGKKYGLTVENVSIDHSAVAARKDKVVRVLVSGIRAQLKACGATLVEGEAKIKGKTAEGYVVAVGADEYTAKHLLLATGSEAIVPPIPGLREGITTGFVCTNREILDAKLQQPKTLAVIGGGVIGLEMASYFNSIGTKVTVIEMLPKIGGPLDDELAATLQKEYEKKGITFLLNTKAVSVGDGKVVYEKDGAQAELETEKVLCCIGRRPSVAGIGLENIGVNAERAIKVDEFGKTNVPNVYCAGDANGTSMLAHTAYREAEVCVNNMLGKKDMMRYDAIPSIIYTNPEVAWCGMNEAQAKAAGIDYEVAKISMRYSGRFVAENEGADGICKIIVNKKYNTVIGVHMLGNPSSEIIYGAAMMIENEMRVDDIKEIVFPHPTVSEILREAIFEI